MFGKTYRDIYRKEMGIKWDGKKYEVHHINFNHNDNRIENLILLPTDLHRKFHNLMRNAVFDWEETMQSYIIGSFMFGAQGLYRANLNWFQDFSKAIKEMTIWGFLKECKYRNGVNGKQELEQIDGIWSE